MKSRLLVALVVAVALASTRAAIAGGPFEQLVGVGADGASLTVPLRGTGIRSDAVLRGAAVAAPGGGYVRVYPSIGGLPGMPGRYYPASRVICVYRREPVSNCSRLGVAGAKLLAPLAALPRRRVAPTEGRGATSRRTSRTRPRV